MPLPYSEGTMDEYREYMDTLKRIDERIDLCLRRLVEIQEIVNELNVVVYSGLETVPRQAQVN